MGVYDIERYPSLLLEKAFISEAIRAGKIVLGICLGAQLIASVLGAKITRNKHREIGWHKVLRSKALDQTILNNVFPHQIDAFYWIATPLKSRKKRYRLHQVKPEKTRDF